MKLLSSGILLFSLVHIFPCAMKDVRSSVVEKLGTNRYRGLFALLIALSLVMIVFGWKSALPTALYSPPIQAAILPSLLVLVAFILFVAAQAHTNIKRLIRHPQLTGVITWGIAHLLTNGDSRSITLFGGLTLWAIIAMVLCSRRDGVWRKPDAVAFTSDFKIIVAGAIGFAVVLYAHQYLFGVSPIPQ